MNWARYKLLIVSGGITLILSVGLIFWILSSSSSSQDLERSVRSLEQKQAQLVGSELYPSQANLTALQEEQQKVRERRDELIAVMREGQVSVNEISRSVFGDYVNEVVPDLRNAAASSTKGGGNGVILQDPDFGWSEYLAGTLPSQRRINELVVQIETIKQVADVLFDSGISELVTISVVEQTTEEESSRGSTRRSTRTARENAPTENAATPDQTSTPTLASERDRLFDTVPVTVEFRAYEDFLWEVLNEILSDPNQIVISSVSITNSNRMLWPEYLETPMSVSGGRESRRDRRSSERNRRPSPENDLLSMLTEDSTPEETPEEQEEKKAGLAARQQNLVGGDLLNVVLKLNVYRLKPVEETETQPEGA